MTTLLESLCSCIATGYLGNIAMICDRSTINEVIVQGQIVGTPTVSSDELVDQLQSFILNQPQPLVYQGQALTYVQRCSVAVSTPGEASCNSASEPSTTNGQDMATPEASGTQLPFAIIGGAAGGGVLLIIIVIVVAMVIFMKTRRRKGYNIETRNTVEM